MQEPSKMISFRGSSLEEIFETQDLLELHGIIIGDTGMFLSSNIRDIQIPARHIDEAIKIIKERGLEIVSIKDDIDIEED